MRKTLCALLLAAVHSACLAGVDKIYSPAVEQGELELEARGLYVLDDDTADGDQTTKIGVGYGVNAVWFVEGYAEFEKESGESAELEAFEVESRFQLSETGEYAIDFGALVEIEKVREVDLWELQTGALLQKDFGQWTAITNLLVERQFGDDKTEDEWEFVGRAQLKYRLSQAFEPGIEYHGDENTQAAGLVGMGAAHIGEVPVKWLAGVIFGLDDDTPDTMLRWEFELEF